MPKTNQRARHEDHRRSRTSWLQRDRALLALLAPGLLFCTLLVALSAHERFTFLRSVRTIPWELWMIAVCGTTATAAGVLDHRLHLRIGAKISQKERAVELAALVFGGLPLFALMAIATWTRARAMLLPVLAQTALVAALVLNDELRFHRRRCGAYETALHRTLVFGQALALLAWMHFAFVRRP
jgi:hypothetical protein